MWHGISTSTPFPSSGQKVVKSMWKIGQERSYLKLTGGDIGIQPNPDEIKAPPPKGWFERFKRYLFGDPRPPRFHFIIERPFNTAVEIDSCKMVHPRDGNGFSDLYLKYRFVPEPQKELLRKLERQITPGGEEE